MPEKGQEGKRKNPVELRKEFLEGASQRLQELAKIANRDELSLKLNEIIAEAAHSYVFYRGRINEERRGKEEALKAFNEELTNAGIPADQRSQYYIEHEWVDPKENKAKHQILLRFDIAQKIGKLLIREIFSRGNKRDAGRYFTGKVITRLFNYHARTRHYRFSLTVRGNR